jgi:hypothetical protein
MKIYQVVQKVFIDPLYLKPARPLGRFCPTVNNLVTMVHKQSKPTWLQWLPFLPTVKKFVAMVTMVHNPNPLLSKAHLTNLDLSNFKVIETMGLRIIAFRHH